FTTAPPCGPPWNASRYFELLRHVRRAGSAKSRPRYERGRLRLSQTKPAATGNQLRHLTQLKAHRQLRIIPQFASGRDVSHEAPTKRAPDAVAANPVKSDRRIAEEIGVSHTTVQNARKATGNRLPVEKRTASTPQAAIGKAFNSALIHIAGCASSRLR
ncbi:hypothetical protein ACO2JO_17975, partial [Leptospira interrogans]